uniref:Acylphosphatase n=1 Tax=Gracilinema caldarium TaxID=215591 RepID=A0A7C3E6Y6_9SPIR
MALDDKLPQEAIHCHVLGMVQGVGFRYSAMAEARKIGVVGWVRNCSDGSVEVYAEGSAEQLKRFLSWLHRGPPSAVVDHVQVRHVVPMGTYKGFSVEY